MSEPKMTTVKMTGFDPEADGQVLVLGVDEADGSKVCFHLPAEQFRPVALAFASGATVLLEWPTEAVRQS